MNLPLRIDLLERLGNYMLSNEKDWETVKQRASEENAWFLPEFVELSTGKIARTFLQRERLEAWIKPYRDRMEPAQPRQVGIVMAGNIPLVGVHDLIAVYITGHRALVKASSKDSVLVNHLAARLAEWSGDADRIRFSELLRHCEAYIATGSNNSARYFEYYFGKYPNIIRRSRTSAAILTGTEGSADLEKLADDVYQYFGMGCRNVTKIFVPENYDFLPLLSAFGKYNYLSDHHKYRNNYDYNLALHILNGRQYMTNGSILLVQDGSLFSPVGQLHYEHYRDYGALLDFLRNSPDLQALVGEGLIPFGAAQDPALDNYADNVNTLEFLLRI
ncbi:MAG TPA: acyl-CoA reductase [Chitinophagaceae bacterium]|nr:acyl-CoA reductase [Chitinophagaceae bacterium]